MKIVAEVEFIESDNLRIDRARSKARRLGYSIKESIGDEVHIDSCVSYIVLDAEEHVVAGSGPVLTLDQLEEWLDQVGT
jgi:hypothetical protein